MDSHNSKITVESRTTCSEKGQSIFTQENEINFFMDYELDKWSRDLNTNFTLGECFFGAVKLTSNADPNKYGYSG